MFVLGSTAVGKTKFALECAKKHDGVILNADSLQVYQRLDIGTAKPDVSVRQSCPHELFDVVAPGELFTVGDYHRLAMPVIEKRIQRQSIFVVGGSGFYIQALDKGLYDAPATPPDLAKKLEEELLQFGPETLLTELAQVDPATAQKLSKNDHYRIMRAVAVLRLTGKSWSQLRSQFTQAQQQTTVSYKKVKLGLTLEKESLRRRLYERTEQMLKAGLLEEVEALLCCGFKDWPALQSIGYKEALLYFQGQLPREQLVEAIVSSSLQLAKKQMTWFKRDPEIKWFHAEREWPEATRWVDGQLAEP